MTRRTRPGWGKNGARRVGCGRRGGRPPQQALPASLRRARCAHTTPESYLAVSTGARGGGGAVAGMAHRRKRRKRPGGGDHPHERVPRGNGRGQRGGRKGGVGCGRAAAAAAALAAVRARESAVGTALGSPAPRARLACPQPRFRAFSRPRASEKGSLFARATARTPRLCAPRPRPRLVAPFHTPRHARVVPRPPGRARRPCRRQLRMARAPPRAVHARRRSRHRAPLPWVFKWRARQPWRRRHGAPRGAKRAPSRAR